MSDKTPPASDRKNPLCPVCGLPLKAVQVEPGATAQGIWVKCKNPECKQEVEVKT